MTPKETWSEMKPTLSLSHLRILGYPFFFSNMSKAEIRKKLDDKREANGVIEVYHPTYECLQVLQFYYKEGCGE